MKSLFKNPEHGEHFEKNGYILLPGLDESETLQLRDLYNSSGLKDDNNGSGIYVGIDMKNKRLVSEMVERFSEIILPKVQEYLNDSQLILASFVVKEFNPMGAVLPHQDWSIVEDETRHYSASCWIPLQDVNINNGCLGLIKGSNHFFDNIRPSPYTKVVNTVSTHNSTIFPYLELIEMKAGEALIFNSKCIHASPPNITHTSRIAIVLLFSQKEAQKVHYYLKPGTKNKVLKYKITPDFFLKYSNTLLIELYEKGLRIDGYGEPEEISYDPVELSNDQLIKMMEEAGNTYKDDLANRVKVFFDNDLKRNDSSKGASDNTQPDFSLPFWKVYTPANILKEIKHRITKK